MIAVSDLSTHRCKGDVFTEIFTVSFFGHRQIKDVFAAEEILEQRIPGLLRSHEYVELLVGRGGAHQSLQYAQKAQVPMINLCTANRCPKEDAI